ncbi:MAG: hypothetical protein QNI87_01505 [Erythrobacter sp.]|uniref:hypothetical protein n=1 Tax=Erythrobacter sp. TaxID=1042 RepID=UPI002625BB68|nr:hypothetical protein [Erythrobacter sp.]MDJ0977191.1 hypothetical protein [Erythrobacter sp.]
MPYIDSVWRVKSSIELDEPFAASEVFGRLDPLLRTQGTEFTISGDTLTYQKTNPAAQDKLATFTAGTLSVVDHDGAKHLAYDVTSTALFLCFLAPLAFLAFGGFAWLINEIEKPAVIAEMAEKEKEEAESEGEADEVIELHWIDQLLGAPAPKQPGEEDQDKAAREGREDEVEGNHSPTTAWVFAGIFFAIYAVGRVLEPYLLKRTFRAALAGPAGDQFSQNSTEKEAGSALASTGEERSN